MSDPPAGMSLLCLFGRLSCANLLTQLCTVAVLHLAPKRAYQHHCPCINMVLCLSTILESLSSFDVNACPLHAQC
jgi:hypothetical protein